MNYLKITSKGWAGYNGIMGGVVFKDGVSIEPVPQSIEDRLTGVTQMTRVDENGEHIGPAGIAHRLVENANARAPLLKELRRQSESERHQEERLDALRADKPPVDRFYTAKELEEIVDQSGIKGLREIADRWDVRDRSIPKLIELTLAAQASFLEKRNRAKEENLGRLETARKEAELQALEDAEKARLAQEEADRLAAILKGHEDLAEAYVAGENIIPAAVIVTNAWQASSMTLTGWNNLNAEKRQELIEAEFERLDDFYGVKLEAKTIQPAEEPGEKSAETLLGSSILASTYEIGGETVQLGDIVASAHARFGGSVDEWNALGNDEREDLLRLDLDQRLAQEAA